MAPIAGGFRHKAGFRDSEDVIRSLHLFLYLSFDSFCGWAFHIVERLATGLIQIQKEEKCSLSFSSHISNLTGASDCSCLITCSWPRSRQTGAMWPTGYYRLMRCGSEAGQTKKQRSATTEKHFIFFLSSEDFTIFTQNLPVAFYITLENLFSSSLAIFTSFTLFPWY